MNIKFIPITKIRKNFKGVRITLFVPSEVYTGIKYPDGTILAKSPHHYKTHEINENDIIIVK